MKKLVAITLLVLVGSCSTQSTMYNVSIGDVHGFGTVNYYNTDIGTSLIPATSASSPVHTPTEQVPVKVVVKVKKECLAFVPPKLPPQPKITSQQLNALPKGDVDALNKLTVDHVIELNEYIETIKKLYTDAIAKQKKTCSSE